MGKSGISRMVLASVSLLIISLFNTFIEFFVSRGTFAPYRPQSTSSTLMSLGDTPGIRLAWVSFPDLSSPAAAGFGRKRLDGIIVEPSFNLYAFQPCQFICYDSLASDIAFVLDKYFRCFDYFVSSVCNFILFSVILSSSRRKALTCSAMFSKVTCGRFIKSTNLHPWRSGVVPSCSSTGLINAGFIE